MSYAIRESDVTDHVIWSAETTISLGEAKVEVPLSAVEYFMRRRYFVVARHNRFGPQEGSLRFYSLQLLGLHVDGFFANGYGDDIVWIEERASDKEAADDAASYNRREYEAERREEFGRR